MTTKHRIIYDGSRQSLLTQACRFLAGGFLPQLRGEAVARCLTLLRLPSAPVHAYLRMINIEMTDYCNQRCRFCATGLNNNKRPKGKMDLATFKKIAADVPRSAVVMLAGFGEPFVNEHLEDCLEHAASLGLTDRLDLYSNFGVLTEPRVRNLLNHPFRRIIISLDAMSRQSFIDQKGVDEFDRVLENIHTLADEVKQRGGVPQKLIVQMIVTKKTAHEQERFLETIGGLGLTPRLKRLNTHSPRFSEQEIKEFEVEGLSRYAHKGYSRRCEWVWGGMLVYWNGDVTLCCQDPTGLSTYGNIHREPLPELLNSSPARCAFRRRYFADPGQIDICRHCDIA
jgi:MoaA/NifB/PqqE/SkfB family radical SAM enzyme